MANIWQRMKEWRKALFDLSLSHFSTILQVPKNPGFRYPVHITIGWRGGSTLICMMIYWGMLICWCCCFFKDDLCIMHMALNYLMMVVRDKSYQQYFVKNFFTMHWLLTISSNSNILSLISCISPKLSLFGALTLGLMLT